MMVRKAHILITLLVLTGLLYRIVTFQPIHIKSGSTINTKVKIIQTPKLKGTQQQIKVKEINKNTAEFNVYTNRYPSFMEGDVLTLKGKVKDHHIISHPQLVKQGNNLNQIQKSLMLVRNKFQLAIQKSLPEPHASIVLGMLLGIESDMPPKIEEDLKRTGTIHMLVVSGFNITLVSAFVMRLAGFLKRKYTIVLAILTVWLFVVIAGAQAPALRAGVMASLALAGSYYGRPTQALYLLLLSVIILLAISPGLLTSLSFQLSCFATAGIILLPENIKYYLNRIGNESKEMKQKESRKISGYLTSEIATTLAAQVAVTPLLLNSFGSLSLIAPLSNIAVAWSIPYIMITGLCVGLAGLLHSLIGITVATTVVPFTAYFLLITEYTATLPFAYFEEIKINLALTTGIYLILVYAVIKNNYIKNYSKNEE